MPSSPDKDYELQRKLEELLAQAHVRGQSMEFDLNSLYDRLQADSLARLALVLGPLVREGKVRLVFRVLNPSGEGLADFSSMADIPPTLEDRYHDWRPIEVTADRVLPVYLFA